MINTVGYDYPTLQKCVVPRPTDHHHHPRDVLCRRLGRGLRPGPEEVVGDLHRDGGGRNAMDQKSQNIWAA